jgi:hypothetical protein
VEAEIVEPIATRSVSALMGERRRNRFPSVLLQPLGHLSLTNQQLTRSLPAGIRIVPEVLMFSKSVFSDSRPHREFEQGPHVLSAPT